MDATSFSYFVGCYSFDTPTRRATAGTVQAKLHKKRNIARYAVQSLLHIYVFHVKLIRPASVESLFPQYLVEDKLRSPLSCPRYIQIMIHEGRIC